MWFALSAQRRSFTPQQLCVLLNASEQSDLSGVLGDWGPNLSEEVLPDNIAALQRAATELLGEGLIEVYLSETPPDETLSMADAVAVLNNPRAWWNGEEGPEKMLWLLLTDAGRAAIQSLSRDELYSYQHR